MKRKFALVRVRASRRLVTRSLFTSTIVLAMAPLAASSADLYWSRGAATNIWATAGNWSTDIYGTSGSAAAPVATDVAIFNTELLMATAQTVELNANHLALGLVSNSTGTVLLQGNGAIRTLTLGTSGITKTGTGAFTIGSAITANLGVGIVLAANQTWTNSAAGEVVVHNAITGAFGLDYAGGGVFRLGGFTEAGGTDLLSTYSGLTTIKAGTTVIAQCNTVNTAPLGSTAGGTVIESGAMLDLGGTGTANILNLGTEAFTVSGTGVGGIGAIVNAGTNDQQNAIQGAVTMVGDTTFGGSKRWDIRSGNGLLNGGGFTLTKVGTNTVGITGGAKIGTALNQVVVRSGEFLMESGAVNSPTTMTNGVLVQSTTAVASSFRSWGNYADHTGNFLLDSTIAGSVANLIVENGFTTHSGAITVSGADTRLETRGNFVMTVNGVIASTASSDVLRKEQTGLLLLNNDANTFDGIFNLNGGTLGGIGTLASSELYVAGGTTVAPGLVNSAGTFDVTNKLISSGINTAIFNVGSATDLLNVGTLTQDGTTNVVVAPGPGYAPGTYKLYDYTTLDGLTGFGGFTLAANHIDASLVNSGTSIDLVVNSSKVPTWNGVSNGIWQSGSMTNPILPNFTFSPAPGGMVEFVNNDAVLFDDTATGTTLITTNGTIAPAATRFNNTAKDYTITGTISGTGSIIKDGSGITTLLSTPSTIGGLDINAGTLQLGGPSNSVSYQLGSIDIAAGATLAVMAGDGAAAPVLGTAPSVAGTAGGTMITGSGTILLNNTTTNIFHNFLADRASVTISGDMSGFTGNIIVNDGNRLAVNAANSLGNASSLLINDGGTLYSSQALMNYAGPITVSGIGWKEATGSLGAIRLQGGTLSGPITLAGDTRMSGWSGSGTISGVISGPGKNLEFGLLAIGNGGAGTLNITNPANTFSGNTAAHRINLNVATLANTGTPSSLGSGSSISMQSGSVVVTGDLLNPTAPQTTNRPIILNQLGQGGGNLGVATPGLVVTYTGAITNGNADFPISTMNFSQTVTPGTGGTVVLNTATPIRVSGTTVHRTNLTLAGNTQYTVDWATVGTAAAPLGNPGAFNVGNNQSATDTGPAVLTVQDSSNLTTYGEFDIGNANSGAMQTATVNQTGGTVNALRGGFMTGADNRAMRIGHWANNTATYNLSGGTLNAPNSYVAVGWDGTGIFNQSGGTANVGGLRFANSATTGVGTVNLTGGVLNIGTLGMLRAAGSATFNFDGGTYRATASHAISGNIVINVQAGGGTIDTNGYNVNSASALLAGTVAGGVIAKTGAGEFNVPAGDNTMVGVVNVNGGSFGGLGTLSAATVNVNNGGTLAGTLSVTSLGGVTVASGGTISPGANGGAANGTLSASAAALTAGSTIQVSGNGDVFAVSGALSGATTISVVPTGTLPGGPIQLVTYGANSLSVTPSLPHLTGATVVDNGFGAIELNYTTQEVLTWTGSGGAVWDYATGNTWNASTTGATLFIKGDLAEFGDTSTVGNVVVQAAGVTPASVTFSNSVTPYTLTGGEITGGGSISKTGTANVVLANNNSYAGTTDIGAGTLQIGNGGATGTLGLGATTIAGGATLSFNRTGTSTAAGVISGGGIVRSDGPGTTILAGANGYSGGTVISKGTLTGYMANSFGSGQITLNDTSTGTSNTGLTFEAIGSDNVITIANPITVANFGTGTVTIGSSERSLRAIGTIFTGALSLGRDVTMLGEWDRTTFSGVISGTADTITIGRSPGLDAGINGRVTWEQANTFTAATAAKTTIQILEGATLEVGGGNRDQIPDTATVNVQAGGTFQLATAGDSEVIGNLTGAGTVRNRVATALSLTFGTADNAEFSGVINGGNTMSYLKQGSGTATWSGNLDNPTGNIRVVAGTMVFAKESTPFVHAVGGNSFIQPGATLKLAGTYTDTRPQEDGRSAANTAPLNFTANYVDQIYNNANMTITGAVGATPAAVGTLDMNGKSEAINGLISAGTHANTKVTNSVADTTSILYVGRNNAASSYLGILEDGAGKLELQKTGTGILTLGGDNTYTGTTTIFGGGRITMTHVNALGSPLGGTVLQCTDDAQYGSLYITLAASTPEAPNVIAEPFTLYSESESDQRSEIVNSVESTRLTGEITLYGDGINQVVASQTAASLDRVYLDGPINGTANGVLFLRGVGEMQVNGVINAPNLQVAKTDTGLLIINSSGNNYGEATWVHGTVRTDVANAFDPTAVMRMGQTGNANTVDLNGFNQTVAGIRINNGVTDAFARTVTSNSAPADLTIDTPTADGGDYNYTGMIAGQLSLIKAGPGSQVLGGSNTYSGITNVNAGSLYINGNHTGGGEFNVAGGALLGGEGSIDTAGNVTFAGGSTLRVGNVADAGGGDDLSFTLGAGSAFTLNSSTTLSLDLWANLHRAGQLDGADQTQSDVLAVNASTINLAGILNVANPSSISSWAVGDTFDLFDWFAAPTGTFAAVNLPTLGSGLSWDTSKLYTSEADDSDLAGTIRVASGGVTYSAIETWRLANFGSIANTGNGADNADPDKDRIPNVVEYAFGMNPNVSSPIGLPTSGFSTGSGTINFGRNLAATDVTYVVQASSNLVAWTDLVTRTAGMGTWSPVAGGVVVTDPGTGPVTIKDNVTVAAQPKRFMRVIITNPLP